MNAIADDPPTLRFVIAWLALAFFLSAFWRCLRMSELNVVNSAQEKQSCDKAT